MLTCSSLRPRVRSPPRASAKAPPARPARMRAPPHRTRRPRRSTRATRRPPSSARCPASGAKGRCQAACAQEAPRRRHGRTICVLGRGGRGRLGAKGVLAARPAVGRWSPPRPPPTSAPGPAPGPELWLRSLSSHVMSCRVSPAMGMAREGVGMCMHALSSRSHARSRPSPQASALRTHASGIEQPCNHASGIEPQYSVPQASSNLEVPAR